MTLDDPHRSQPPAPQSRVLGLAKVGRGVRCSGRGADRLLACRQLRATRRWLPTGPGPTRHGFALLLTFFELEGR